MKTSNLEILAYEMTELGVLCLRRRELLGQPGTIVTDVTLDHELLMSSYLTLSERTLARRALDLHSGRALRVLVGGLGLGYTACEVGTAGGARVTSIEVMESLPQVIDWVDRDLVPLAGALRADPRLRIVQGDVYARLSGAPERSFDLILIDVDHSPDEHLGGANASFYTEAGLARARHHLAEGGILGIWSYAEHSPFATALRRVFSEVHVEGVTVTNHLVGEEQTDWLFFARNEGPPGARESRVVTHPPGPISASHDRRAFSLRELHDDGTSSARRYRQAPDPAGTPIDRAPCVPRLPRRESP